LKQHKPWFDEEYLGLLDQSRTTSASAESLWGHWKATKDTNHRVLITSQQN